MAAMPMPCSSAALLLEAAEQNEAAIGGSRHVLAVESSGTAGGRAALFQPVVAAGRPGLDAHQRGLTLGGGDSIIHWSLGYAYALLGPAGRGGHPRAMDAGTHPLRCRTRLDAYGCSRAWLAEQPQSLRDP